VPERLPWQYSDQVLEELGFCEPDAVEEFQSLLFQLAGNPTDESQLIQPVPGRPDLMTVTFDSALLLYQIGRNELTALVLRQLPGTP
jgi:hypothetical protein